jgi:hypothetical protein
MLTCFLKEKTTHWTLPQTLTSAQDQDQEEGINDSTSFIDQQGFIVI